MESLPNIRDGVLLEEFLGLPVLDENPYLNSIDGRVAPKVSPQRQRSGLSGGLQRALDGFAIPRGIGLSFVELRHTFASRSIVPDISFYHEACIELDEAGEYVDDVLFPPEAHIEINSPKQGVLDADEKLRHSTAHSCDIGWPVHPYCRTTDEYRPGQGPRRQLDDGVLDGASILPGFRLPASEVWRRLNARRRGENQGAPA